MNQNEQRRLYADEVLERRRLERQQRIDAGTEPSLGTKTKQVAEAVVTGILIGEFIKAMRN